MKKIIIILAFVLLFTGCKKGEKKPVILSASCKTNIALEDNKVNYEDILTFEDDILISVKSVRNIDYLSQEEEKVELYNDYLLSIMNVYNNIDGVKATVDKNIITIDFDITKMSEEELKNNGFETKDKIKLIELYQAKGYTCN